MPKLLVVDDEPAVVDLFQGVFEKQGIDVVGAASAAQAIRAVTREQPDVAVLDVLLPDGSGLDVFRELRQLDAKLPVIVMTGGGDSGTAIEAMGLGALDYLTKPLNVRELTMLVDQALEIRRLMNEPVQVDAAAGDEASGNLMIGRCPAMQNVYKAIGRVASQNVTVLIRGESGTGKELVARALYQYSARRQGPFLAVNCAAIPESLLESELFGHEKGAFTSADKKRIGKFEQCSGGTLFLDEIGDMSAILQSKLLRVLQEKTFDRVGGNETIRTDVRVISATNRDLEKMVADKLFREDLFYRLDGYTIELPPLREREEDLPTLVDHFRRMANRDLGKEVKRVSDDAMTLLLKFGWAGNVRQLQSVVRQSVLQTTGPVLLPAFLPDVIRRGKAADTSVTATNKDSLDGWIERSLTAASKTLYDDVIADVDLRIISRVLQHCGGSQSEAAKVLGMSRTTLRSKIDKLGIKIGRVVQSGE
jgi:two-component system nitrogen regulation response regulator GlnG